MDNFGDMSISDNEDNKKFDGRLESMKIQPMLCRAARGALDWSQEKLATEAGVSASTIKNFEAVRRTPHPNRLDQIEKALVNAGIEFVDAEDGVCGPGIRLRIGIDPDRRIVEEREAEEAEDASSVEKVSPEDLAEFRAHWDEGRLSELSEIGRSRIRREMGVCASEGEGFEAAAE